MLNKRLTSILCAASILMVTVVGCGSSPKASPSSSPQAGNSNAEQGAANTMSWKEAPAMEIDTSKSYQAVFTTNKGSFTIELLADEAPGTVNNFVFLARQHYYDAVTFHRIDEDFMIQTGDPTGTGRGNPGYTIKDELDTTRTYEPGIVAMAKSQSPNSAGSQFFICTGPVSEDLNSNPDYPIFGKVSDGMDVVMQIAATPVAMNPESGEISKPTETVSITSIEIVES